MNINNLVFEQSTQVEQSAYNLVRNSILDNLRAYGPLTFSQLAALVEDHLKHKFDGSIVRHFDVVELDIEAVGEIRRVPHSQFIEIAE